VTKANVGEYLNTKSRYEDSTSAQVVLKPPAAIS
jgi:hypothetical protein